MAGSYTAEDRAQIDRNIERARHAGAMLLARGWLPIVPHMLTAHGDEWPEIPDEMKRYERANDPRNVFVKMGLALLLQCEAILMLEGWQESKGACAEYNLAVALGLEIYQEDEGYPHPDPTRREPEVFEP